MYLLYYNVLIALAPDRERIEMYGNSISPHPVNYVDESTLHHCTE